MDLRSFIKTSQLTKVSFHWFSPFKTLSEGKFFQYYDRLKQEHEALKEAYTSLKEATGLLLLDRKSDKSVCTTTSQLLTLLVDTSTMEMGSTLLSFSGKQYNVSIT